jgi:hypothetical protein
MNSVVMISNEGVQTEMEFVERGYDDRTQSAIGACEIDRERRLSSFLTDDFAPMDNDSCRPPERDTIV